MKKRILVIIIILLVLILLGGGAFAYTYFFTDIFRSNKEIFVKYISQNEEIVDLFKDENIKAYSEKQKNTPYTTNGTLKTNVTFPDSTNQEMATALQNCNISFEGQVDNANNFNHQTVKANYSDSQALIFELLQNNDVFGVKANDVFDRFIGIQNSDLKALATKFGEDEETISKIPDKIDFEKMKNYKLFTDEEFSQIKDKYLNIVLNDLTDEMFSKEENSQSNVYTLTIDEKQMEKLAKDLLSALKDDDAILNKIKTIMTQEFGASEADASQTIQRMKNSIESIVNENIESSDTTSTPNNTFIIKTYANNKKLNKTELIIKEGISSNSRTSDNYDETVNQTSEELGHEYKFVVEKIENGINLVIPIEDSEKYFNVSIQKTTPANEIKYDIAVSQGEEKLFDFSIRFFGINTDEVVETSELSLEYDLSNIPYSILNNHENNSNSADNNMESVTTSSKTKFVWTYNNTKKFTTEILKEGIDNNILLINTAPSIESIQNTFTQLGNRLVQMNSEKMTAAGLQDNGENPFMYYIPGVFPMFTTKAIQENKDIGNYGFIVVSGIIALSNNIHTNATTTIQDANLTDEAINTFNAMFEAYKGERQGKALINTLIAFVKSNNTSSEHKVVVEVTKLDGTKINGLDNFTAEGNMYSVEMEKDAEGYINKIIITEVL